jgi:hypothetical protein
MSKPITPLPLARHPDQNQRIVDDGNTGDSEGRAAYPAMTARGTRAAEGDCGDNVQLGPRDVERIGGSNEAGVSDSREPAMAPARTKTNTLTSKILMPIQRAPSSLPPIA